MFFYGGKTFFLYFFRICRIRKLLKIKDFHKKLSNIAEKSGRKCVEFWTKCAYNKIIKNKKKGGNFHYCKILYV